MTRVTCDSCEIPFSGPRLVLSGGDIQDLDFCSWDCVADYARVTAYAMEPQLEPPCC
jgi:hypothetical protein